MPRTCIALAVASATVTSVPLALAQAPTVGYSSSALPGLRRVPMVALGANGLHAAADAGYSLTESQGSEGIHQRISGSLGLGLVATKGLEFSLLSSIRNDRHPSDALGPDNGTIGQVSAVSRYGARVNQAFALGIDLGVLFPGAEKVGDSLGSPALDARALLGFVPDTGVRVAGYAGYRLDRTQGVGRNASRYRMGDRLALGLSDFDALLVGAGVAVPVGKIEVIGEITGDVLVGQSAPAWSKSPLRIDLGARSMLTARLQIELLSEVVLSARPELSVGAPLIPVEPRFGISVGLRYHATAAAEPHPAGAVSPVHPVQAAPKPPSNIANAALATGRLTVAVVDRDGHPLSDANVRLVTDSGERTLEFRSGSTFSIDAPVGKAHVVVTADLMRAWDQEVEIVPVTPLELRVEMLAADVSGQIRGQARDFDGTRLAAHVHIEPGDRETRAQADGTFSVDVPPGRYRVKIWLEGYQSQMRTVEVGKGGVMVLNVDMQKGR